MPFTSASLTIDAIAVPSDQIHGLITVSRRENEASTMEVTLLTPAGVQAIESWAGKPVVLTVNGSTAFTGVIDMPEIDVIYKRITLVCTDKRREGLNAALAATIGTIGYYSDAIFSDAENVIDELDQRLQTIPSVADLKPDGTYAITDINPKTLPDITLTDSDVYRRKPEVSPTSRLRLTNQVNLTFDFRYTRLRHRERGFKIEDLPFCDILDLGPAGSFTLKNTFISNAELIDWHIKETSIVWEEMPPSGSTSPPCTVDIIYVHDDRFATSMTFDSATRFAQTITESFDITVKAPQSINQYGLIDWNQVNGYEVEYDAKDWEDYQEYSAPTGGTDDPNDYYIDKEGVSTDFDNAILTAINMAATKIIKSHRDTQVKFETDLRMDFDLTKTIELSSSTLDAKGKVTAIEHYIDIANRFGHTTTEISLSTAQGAQIQDPLTVPTRPPVPVVSDPFTNPLVLPIAGGTIDTPAIDDTSRNEQSVVQVVSYNLEIQNDTFGVTF